MSAVEKRGNVTPKDINLGKPEIEKVNDTVVIIFPDEAFVENAPVDKATLKTVAQYHSKFKKHVAEESAKLAEKEFGKSKKVQTVIVKTQFGTAARDMLTTNVDRSKTFTNPQTKEKVSRAYMSQQVKLTHLQNKTQLKNLSKQVEAAIAG